MGQLKLVLLAGETRWRARKLNCDKNFENDLDWHEKKGLYIQLHELFNVAKFLSINSVESKCTGNPMKATYSYEWESSANK